MAPASTATAAAATDSGNDSPRHQQQQQEQEEEEGPLASPPPSPPSSMLVAAAASTSANAAASPAPAPAFAAAGAAGRIRTGGGSSSREAMLRSWGAAAFECVPYLFALGLLLLHLTCEKPPLLSCPPQAAHHPSSSPSSSFPFPFIVYASAAFVPPAATAPSSCGSRWMGRRVWTVANPQHYQKRAAAAPFPLTTLAAASSSASAAAASAAALVGEGKRQELRLEAASAAIPHPRKADTGGEDASFVLPMDLGVFDGVGGWSVVEEADTGLYSKLFANHTAAHLRKQREAGVRQVDHVAALQHALKETDAIGSTTACLASLVPGTGGSIVGLNLGDSGLLLLRRKKQKPPRTDVGAEDGAFAAQDEFEDFEPDLAVAADDDGDEESEGEGEDDEEIGRHRAPFEVLFRTKMQTHDFNTPFQLGTNCTDRPEFGQLYFLQAEEGDILLMASDGLFDNLYDQEILKVVESAQSMPGLATALVQKAFDCSRDAARVSPWQLSRSELSPAKKKALHPFAWKRKKAEQQAMCGLDETGRPLRALGGKRDDITVVVARVVR